MPPPLATLPLQPFQYGQADPILTYGQILALLPNMYNNTQRTGVGASGYTILTTDRYIGLTLPLAGPVTWPLPPASTFPAGTALIIADEVAGITASNTLSIRAAGADTIDGLTAITLNAPYQVVILYSDATSRWTYTAAGTVSAAGNTTTVGLYASLPATPTKNGDTYQCSDGPYKFVGVGGAWQAFLNNQAVGVPGPSGGWTQVNFGGKVTLSDAAGVIGLQIAQTAALNRRLITKAVPATPYHVETFIRGFLLNANTTVMGFYFYDGTKLMGVEWIQQASVVAMRVQKCTSVTVDASTPFTTGNNVYAGPQFGGVWARIGNSGANLTFDWALERGDWQNLFTEAVGTFITPTQYGVGGGCITAVGTDSIRIQHLANTLTA